jgi:hypothetical protein
MTEFTGWVEYEEWDENSMLQCELVRVLYRNGTIVTGKVWEINWKKVSGYQREVLQ